MYPKQGDIFWVNIPKRHTEGSEQYGRRPFIVMSRDALNKGCKAVVAVPMTTYQGQINDASIAANQPPFRIVIPGAEIAKDPTCNIVLSLGVAKTDQVRVIDKTRLEGKLGTLSKTAVISVGLGLAWVFDLR
jgi:mRNA-degrading endonuclease toxin of MazEF toxin-antitoxin module